MPWYVLLIIALAGVGLVLAMVVRVGLKAWRLARHGMAVSRRLTPLAQGLARRTDEVATAAERLSKDGEQLNASIAALQQSLARLQVMAQALNDAVRPYALVMSWLTGRREWGTADR
ncbi:MAG: hypothetical protein GX624_06990 [Actinobacteria bacterium]|nr:hypothetical protein [Actinomycetota bacterium]